METKHEHQSLTKKNKKRPKQKLNRRKKMNDDSVQIIEEIDGVDTSIEIVSEHFVKNPTNPVEVTEVMESPTTASSNKGSDNVDNVSSVSKSPIEKAADFISLSSPPSLSQGNQDSIQSTNYKSKCQISSQSQVDAKEEESNDLFQIDRAPGSNEESYVPKYVSKFSESALSEEKAFKKCWRPMALCFNCGGEHAMRDCTQPRNQGSINRNRNIFMANKAKQTGTVSASRYHLDHNQRFSHIKPGVISKRLRRALKLSSDQLPLHVYRMRLLGYPPAWLEEAKVKHSGIAVFDSSGQALADPDDEDGEVEVDRCKYDIKKIIEYPGFNTRPPKGTLNESDYLGFPEMLPEQNKDRMISELASRAALPYKKRKLDARELPSEELDTTGVSIRHSTDMEVDDTPEATKFESPGACAFVPSLPEEPLPVLPPPPQTPPPPGVDEEEEGEIKEEDGEEAKGVKRKVEDLESAEDGEEAKGVKRKVEDLESAGSSKKRKSDVPEFVEPSSSTVSDTITSTLSKSPSTGSLGSIKLLDLGTPIIKHATSVEKLPSHEAFSKDICDVINYDNLPDSTGKYKVLSKVVRRVRTFMSKITGKQS